MSEQPNLESLYAQAQAAIKAKDYEHASELLRQIVVVDETYRDASRLLANVVALQRRRWYNDPRLWGTVGIVILIALGIVIASVLPSLLPTPVRTPTMMAVAPTTTVTVTATTTRIEQTKTATPSPIPSNTPMPSVTPTRAPTTVPLVWKRLSAGQEFPRDGIAVTLVDPQDTDVWYAGGVYSGIFKSVDGGESWNPSHLGLTRASVSGLVSDPQDSRTIYAATWNGGVYKTTDSGEHWRAINQGIPLSRNDTTSQVVIHPANRNLYYVSDNSSPYMSTNGGETWRSVKTSACPNGPASAFAFDLFNPQTMFLAGWGDGICEEALYKSVDGGSTWKQTSLVGNVGNTDGGLVIGGKTGNIVFAVKSPDLFKSADAGNTWSRVFGDCRLLALNPNNPDIVFCGFGAQLNQSLDGGQSWRKLEIGMRVFRSMTFMPSPSPGMLLNGQGVVFSNDNGISWKPRSQGLGNVMMNLVIAQNGTLYAHDTSCVDPKVEHGLFRSPNGGKTWDWITNDHCGLAVDADGVTLYRKGTGQQIVRSQDGGATWIRFNPAAENVRNIAAHPRQSGMLLLSASEKQGQIRFISYSLDGGQSWQRATGVNSNSGNDKYKFYFDHDQGHIVYALSDSRNHYRSSDSGKTWSACGVSATIPSGASDSRAVVDPRNSDKIVVATQGSGILISDNGCKSWFSSNAGLTSEYVNTVAIDPQNSNRIYAGTDGGAFVSFDGGKSWNQINDGLLGALVVYSIVVDTKDSSVYAATPYGVFKLEQR